VLSERRPWRLLVYSVWSLFSTLLTLLAGASLVGGILNAGYDPHENRAPAARIAIAAIATAVGLAAVGCCREAAARRRGARRAAGWPLADRSDGVLLIALLAIVDLASGPL
jgi:hypothetical protein